MFMVNTCHNNVNIMVNTCHNNVNIMVNTCHNNVTYPLWGYPELRKCWNRALGMSIAISAWPLVLQ